MRTQLESVRWNGAHFRIKGRASASEVACVGIALLAVSFIVLLPGAPVSQRLLSAALGLAIAAGLYGMVQRDEVSLDPGLRTWTRQTGYWSRRTTTGGFDDLKGLVLTFEGVKRPRWIVHLAIRGDHNPIRVAEFSSESKAYERFEAIARTLGVDAIDQTRDPATRLSLEPIEHLPGRSRTRSAAIPPLPAGSALHIAGVPPDVSVILPSLRFSVAGVVVGVAGVLVGSLFAGFGVIMWTNRVADANGLPGATYPLVLSFVLIGTCIILSTLAVCIRQEECQNRGDQLVFGYRLFDRLTRRKIFDKHSIEEIAVRTGSGRVERHVFVRTSNRILRVGFTIGARDQEWLQSTLVSWLRD